MLQAPWFRYSIALLLVTCVLGILIREVARNWAELTPVVNTNNADSFALYGLLITVFFGLLANAWRQLMLRHIRNCSWKEVAYVFFAPNLGKYLPGKVLYLLGRVELTQKVTGSRKSAIGCFAAEQVYLILGAAVLGLPAAIRATTAYEPTIPVSVLSVMALGLVVVLVGGRLIAALSHPLGELKEFQTKLNFALVPHNILVANYCFAWAIYALAGYLLADGLFGIEHADSIYVGSAFVLAWIVGFVSVFTPGGMGVREVILAALLLPVISSGEASLLAIVSRVIWTCAELGLAGLALVLGKPGYKEENAGQSSQ